MQIICRTKCYWKSNVWSPGQILEIVKGEKFPKHFTRVKPEAEQIRDRDEELLKDKLTELGIEFDGRWNIDKLEETLKEHAEIG